MFYGKTYNCMLSTYPKEWLITEITQDDLLKYNVKEIRSFEPFWKLILGNKALLPLLWSMYPNHPNLLPAFYDRPDKQAGVDYTMSKYWVSKPLFGREGLGVMVSKNFTTFD